MVGWCTRRRPPPGGREHGSVLHKIGYVVTALVLAAGVLAYQGVIPSFTRSAPQNSRREVPSQPAPLSLPHLVQAPAVLDAPPPDRRLSMARLRATLGPLIGDAALGPHVGVAVADLTGPPVILSGSPPVVTPASTMKLLTTLTALDVLGPDHRFATTTRYLQRGNRLILVGGGDPMLSIGNRSPLTAYPRTASIRRLAAETAAMLRSRGVRTVRLGYDASLFTGPSGNPHWEPSYVRDSVVTRIGALWVDEGRIKPYYGERESDPAAVAAARFGRQLRANGITITARLGPLSADPKSTLLATVESAPLGEIIGFILESSNNEGAEVLLRQIAVAAGREGSSAAGVRVERRVLSRLGVPLRGARIYDGSGLSRDDRLPLATLVRVLQVAASPQHPGLRGVLTGLPIAGFSGTLSSRFRDQVEPALGVVRVKTGTLTGVTAYAGVVEPADGTPLVFVVAADMITEEQTLRARTVLDRIGAALATCGCRS